MQKYILFGPNNQQFEVLKKTDIHGHHISNVMSDMLSKLTFPLEVVAEDGPSNIIKVEIPLEFPENTWALSWFIYEKID